MKQRTTEYNIKDYSRIMKAEPNNDKEKAASQFLIETEMAQNELRLLKMLMPETASMVDLIDQRIENAKHYASIIKES